VFKTAHKILYCTDVYKDDIVRLVQSSTNAHFNEVYNMHSFVRFNPKNKESKNVFLGNEVNIFFIIFMPINLKLLCIFCVSCVTFVYVNSDISCLYLIIAVPEEDLICQNTFKAE
jgi:hypothetical protein